MKKTVLIFLCITAFALFAAEGSDFSRGGVGITGVQPTFEKGDLVLNIGIGLGRTPRGTTGVPPVTVSAEYGLIDDLFTEGLNLGIGAIFGFQTYTVHYFWETTTYFSSSFAARAAVHYPLVENFDIHAGVVTGYRTNPGNVIVGSYVGGRYYFNPNLAVMAELGYGITYINAGVAFKF